MKNILGLHLYNGHVFDRFLKKFVELVNQGVRVADNNEKLETMGKRADMIWFPRQQAYLEVLKELAENDSQFVKIFQVALSRQKKNPHHFISDRGIEKIMFTLWEKLNNEIPVIDLNEIAIKEELKKRGYFYLRIIGASGWYFNLSYIAKDWVNAFIHMESFLDLGGQRIKFI